MEALNEVYFTKNKSEFLLPKVVIPLFQLGVGHHDGCEGPEQQEDGTHHVVMKEALQRRLVFEGGDAGVAQMHYGVGGLLRVIGHECW
jgi:hypothetical protein